MANVPQSGELRTSYPAGEDLSDYEGYFVKLVTGTLKVCDGATDAPAGVLQEGVASGLQAEIVMFGTAKLVAGGAIAIGDQVGTDASGKGDKKIAGTDTTNYVCARALETAASDGDIIAVAVNCITPHRAA